MNNATEPARAKTLSASVKVKPCQSPDVVRDTARVATAVAKAIGVDTTPGKSPRITPARPRTTGPDHRKTGASCDARVGIDRPRKGARPAISPAAPRHMLAATAHAVSTTRHISGRAKALMLSYNCSFAMKPPNSGMPAIDAAARPAATAVMGIVRRR